MKKIFSNFYFYKKLKIKKTLVIIKFLVFFSEVKIQQSDLASVCILNIAELLNKLIIAYS